MTPLNQKNKQESKTSVVLFKNEPYLIVNVFFAGIIMLIMIYSGIFSPEKDNYPVICVHERIAGEPCISCGLSHSFSLILKGKLTEAQQWNINSIRIFLFFASQFILRFAFSILYVRYQQTRRELIILDSIGSGLLLIIAFWPYLTWIISRFF